MRNNPPPHALLARSSPPSSFPRLRDLRLPSGLRLGLGFGLALAACLAPIPSARADVPAALQTLATLGPEGQGNAAATRAWADLAAAPATDLPRLLAAMDTLGDRARNYVFAAASAIAERSQKAGQPLPVEALGAFLLDASHGPRSRRLAYELLARAEPATAEALLPGLLDDPAPDLRREAVQRLLDQAGKSLTAGQKPAAALLYRQALGFARDAEQLEAIAKPLKDLGQPVDLVQVLGFLTTWRVIGPFDNTGRAGFERVFPPEQELKFDAEYDGKDGKVRWKEFTTPHERGMVDFNKAYSPIKEVTGYAYTEFFADAARPAELRIGSENGWKIWFNGTYLRGRDEYHRNVEIDQYRFPVQLQPGRNTLLVKVTQNEEKEEWTVDWGFQLRVTDPTGRVLRSTPQVAATTTR